MINTQTDIMINLVHAKTHLLAAKSLLSEIDKSGVKYYDIANTECLGVVKNINTGLVEILNSIDNKHD